jgi:hypothetical protein
VSKRMTLEDRGFQLFLSTFDVPPGVACNVTSSPMEPAEDFDDSDPSGIEPGDCEPSPDEEHDAIIRRWVETGWIDPNCPGCEVFYAAQDPAMVFAPRHQAMGNCQSGKHSHCTCRSCF